MKPRIRTGWRSFVAFALGLAGPLAAQNIPNPGFEADTFAIFPGYIRDNGPITGWTGTPEANTGLNPAAGSPFANNGTIPEGTNVAFIQSNGGPTSLSTTITGLTSGQRYRLAFRANARGGQTPRLNVAVGGTTLLNSNVRAVGGTAPWHFIARDFTASDTSALLELGNFTTTDTTVCVDAFTVTATTSPWSVEPWVDDTSASLDSTYFYTHAFSFGSAAGTSIAGVPFTGIAGGNPAVAGRFSTTGLGAIFNNDPNNLTGGSRTLANDFLYNGFPASLTLEGLTPGQEYVLNIYSVGWEAPGERFGTFRAGDALQTFDQNTYDNNAGIVFSCRYTAPAGGTMTFETLPVQGASIHWYGFANREATRRAAPSITGEPQDAVGFIGSNATFIGGASGTPPLEFRWFRNGVLIPGAESSTLTLPVTGTTDAAFYHFTVTNGTGTVTSRKAFLEVYQPVAGGLQNTGVDASGVALADGMTDPHWRLAVNPDNFGDETAVVQNSTAFPIVAGPWLPNTATSTWIGPRLDTAGAAGPAEAYRYRTSFDLTGLGTDIIVSGSISVDNTCTGIFLNGTQVPGQQLSQGFNAYTPFAFRTTDLPPGTVAPGLNQLDLDVVNQGAGYTGLRVDDIRLSRIPVGTAPIIIVQPQGGSVTTGTSVTLTSRAYGSGPLVYEWRRNGQPVAQGNGGASLTINPYTIANDGTYELVVSNGAGSATSAQAILVAQDVPPFIITEPAASTIVGVGDTFTLTASFGGSAPLTYVWTRNGNQVQTGPSATLTVTDATSAASGTYVVTATNGFGAASSRQAIVSVRNVIPGVVGTGNDMAGGLLPDGSEDGRYVLFANADGQSGIPAIVHDTTVFPIVTGPWFNTSTTAKWIAPRFNSQGAAGLAGDGGAGAGTYVYRLTFDATGYDPASIHITGGWATDNLGLAIRVNGIATGLTNDAQFPVLTNFTINDSNADFVNGVNTIDFVVQNSDDVAGYTGLLVSGLRGLGIQLPPLPAVGIALTPAGLPVVSYNALANLTYRVQRSPDMTEGTWTTVSTFSSPTDTGTLFTDTDPLPGKSFYRVTVTR